ncbi:unnamed protein product [Acanthoscelides obtectus]|uniref:Uncharacterized protein n=1 Tax=Acanthoscelides obtectus TaxID=200917 RepID=A0A9P0MG70_ACAOB|nr:unnamed protein product [Acanthoscelides obtectus]CAK1670939.1 hypothetical protein AOBTE_LOCUS27933 [Acanthoscelides obtectus]
MLKTISLLEETNNAYSRKIGELEERAKEDRCRLSENSEGNANDQQNILDNRDKQLRTTEENVSLYDELFKQSRNSAKTSKKLLIVGDQLARNCARVLHNSMKSIGYIVEGIVKPNTEAANITSNIFTQTMDHGQSDYVIIVFSTKNISNHKTLNSFLRNVLPLGKFTNLVILLKSEPVDEALAVLLENKITSYIKNNPNCSVKFLVVKNGFRKSPANIIRSHVQTSCSTLKRNVLLSPPIIPIYKMERQVHCNSDNPGAFLLASGNPILIT